MTEQFLHSIRHVDDLSRTARNDEQEGIQFLHEKQTKTALKNMEHTFFKNSYVSDGVDFLTDYFEFEQMSRFCHTRQKINRLISEG